MKAEQRAPEYTRWVPDGLVPMLEVDGAHLTQSLAIIEYLDETHPQPPLLPADALGRARVRALAQSIACEIHPLNNLRVLQYLSQQLQVSDAAKTAWYAHWTRQGLEAFEAQLKLQPPSRFCHGDTPTLADCCLAPQIFNAQRFKVSLDGLDRTLSVFEACMALPAFERAHPSQCPDHA